MDLPDEITLRLRFTSDHEFECTRSQRLASALKTLKRRFGLTQYKRGPANPPEVGGPPQCPRCQRLLHYDITKNVFRCPDCEPGK